MGQIKVEKNSRWYRRTLCDRTDCTWRCQRIFHGNLQSERYDRSRTYHEFCTGQSVQFYQGSLTWTSFPERISTGQTGALVKGSVFDVAVDLRSDSKTYGKWFGVELTEENKKQFYIPEGFAHGFLVLSDIAEFCYKCTDFYHPGDEGGLAWNDPKIGIKWPKLIGTYNGTASSEGYVLEDGTALNLSDKDQKWLGLKDTFKF